MLMPTVISLHYNYLGIDISPTALAKASANLQVAKDIYSYQGEARLLTGDVCSIGSLGLDKFTESSKTLVVLPFNLFGIISCAEKLVDHLHALGFDILIFSYQRSSKVDKARAEYYKKCGFVNIQRVTVRGAGVLFTDHKELHSYAYHPTNILNLMKEVGYLRTKTIPFDKIGIAYYGVN